MNVLRRTPNFIVAFLIFFVLIFLLFSDLLFSDELVLSKEGTDIYSHFLYLRDFGFRQLKQGILPFWNPHLFSGTPYIGDFQSALFYPFNLFFLFFDTPQAINLSILVHIFLLACFSFFWARARNLHTLAAIFCGILSMFCGGFYLHIYAGHLSNICSMVWVPLVFLSIEQLIARPVRKFYLLLIFALSMQILAGHPQYVFYTAVTVLLYIMLLTYFSGTRDWKGLACISMAYSVAGFLAAFQLIPSLFNSTESIRSGGLSYDFASMFSFPPENLITLLTPEFFGDMNSFPYWGRCYLWEMCLYFSVSGLSLFCYALYFRYKKVKVSVLMAALLFILALGSHTPLFDILYGVLPGFDHFRGMSKFSYFSSLFMIIVASSGFHSFMRSPIHVRRYAYAVFCTTIFLGIFALLIKVSSVSMQSIWADLLRYISSSGESYFPFGETVKSEFFLSAGEFAAKSLHQPIYVLLFLCLIFYFWGGSKKGSFAVLILTCVELFSFAEANRPVFSLNKTPINMLRQFRANNLGDYRILFLGGTNIALSTDMLDIWGYDPNVNKRYAEFLAFTQGDNPDTASQYVNFKKYHPLYRMLRCRYVLEQEANGLKILHEEQNILPRLLLLSNWTVAKQRNQIFDIMTASSFDPSKNIVLESYPSIPSSELPVEGKAELLDFSSNHLTIRAEVKTPSLLLITDAYAKGWEVKALKGSSQSSYQLLPANYILQAIPLEAGTHLLKLEYRPQGFTLGLLLSCVTLFALLFWCFGSTDVLRGRLLNLLPHESEKRNCFYLWSALILIVFFLSFFSVRSDDLFMYLAIARRFFENWQFPLSDPFLFTPPSQHFQIMHEWLSYLLFYVVYQIGGWNGLIVAKTLGIIIIALIPAFLIFRLRYYSIYPVVLSLLACAASADRFIERTSLISDGLTALVLALLLVERRKPSNLLYLFPPLFLLWVNLHPGYLVGLVLAFLLLLVDCRKNREPSYRSITFMVILSSLCCLLNPEGLKGALYPLQSFFDPNWAIVKETYFEWRSPLSSLYISSSSKLFFCVLVFLVLLQIVFMALHKNNVLYEFLVFFALCYHGFSAMRFLPTAAFSLSVLGCSLAAKANFFPINKRAGKEESLNNEQIAKISQKVTKDKKNKLKTKPCLKPPCPTSQRADYLSLSTSLLLGLLLIIASWLAINGYNIASGKRNISLGLNERYYPVSAARFLDSIYWEGNVFNQHQFGAYLAWHWDGKHKFFYHGFVDAPLFFRDEYLAVNSSLENFEGIVGKYDLGAFILDAGDAKRSVMPLIYRILFEHPKWHLVYYDQTALVFLKETIANQAAIKSYSFRLKTEAKEGVK